VYAFTGLVSHCEGSTEIMGRQRLSRTREASGGAAGAGRTAGAGGTAGRGGSGETGPY